MKCILIDDDEDEYLILQDNLSGAMKDIEYTLDWVKIPDGAAQFACLNDYDVVFINHRIKDKSGLELLREIRSHCGMLPVVAMSSWGFINNQAEFEALGAAYIRKEEVTHELLMEKIRSVGVSL